MSGVAKLFGIALECSDPAPITPANQSEASPNATGRLARAIRHRLIHPLE